MRMRPTPCRSKRRREGGLGRRDRQLLVVLLVLELEHIPSYEGKLILL